MQRLLLFVLMLSTATFGQNPVGQLFSSDAKVKGAVELAAGGARVMSGSFVTAGNNTAVLKLDRGGEVRVCSATTLSVATSQSGRDLVLGLSMGCIETHYTVSATADSIITPDFRLLLAGPGRFDFAIEAGKNGDTCVRALPGNSSSLIVSELMGDATYQVKPAERLVFHNGHVQDPDHDNANCGCVSAPPVLTAEAPPPEPMPTTAPAEGSRPTPAPAEATPTTSAPAGGNPTSPSPVEGSRPTQVTHVEVDAPFVFHGDEVPPSPLEEAVTLHVNNKPLPLVVLPPSPAEVVASQTNVPRPTAEKISNKKQSGFFGRLKGFFASVFR